MTLPKKTPLFETNKKMNAKIVDFSGWAMPVQYSGVVEEHLAVRNAVGLFDVSHMGEIEIKGSNAVKMVQKVTTNDVLRLQTGDVQYSAMCYKNGGIVDDIIVYKLKRNHYLLCVNAGNSDKDFEWILENKIDNVEITDTSSNYCQLALQGRYAEKILQKLAVEDVSKIKYYNFIRGHIGSVETIISRTGYTGEDGFELYFDPAYAEEVWEKILEEGKSVGIKPIGLAARDSLRLEVGYMLYGNEINKDTLPMEAGLGWIVKMEKGDFIGRDAILRKKEDGLRKCLLGIEPLERGIPRQGYSIFSGNRKIGSVTSGTYSPFLKKAIALAYIDRPYLPPDGKIEIEIRNKRIKGAVIKPPFYKRNY